MAAIPVGVKVIVVPVARSSHKTTCDTLIDDAEDIIASIIRHVDGIENVDYKINYKCEFCSRDWTEIDGKYNGGGCDADKANAPK